MYVYKTIEILHMHVHLRGLVVFCVPLAGFHIHSHRRDKQASGLKN